MKSKISSFVAILALALGFSACTDNWVPKVEQEGTLSLASLSVDVSTAEMLVSRAEGVDISTFTVQIKKGTEVAQQWTYAEMPEIIALPIGDYTVNVYSHEVQKQDWDKPYFIGSKDFTISANELTEIGTILCKFASVKVTIAFDQALLKHETDDWKVTVISNDAGKLEYAVADTVRAGYFAVLDESTTLVATFQGTVDGKESMIQRTFINVQPGTHYNIRYAQKNSDVIDYFGDVNPAGITVDTGVTNVNTGLNLTLEEDVIKNPGERPGTEEPDEPENPSDEPISYTSTTLSFTEENMVSDFGGDTDAIVVLTADKGFAHLYVTISSDNDGFLASAGELMPLSFDLATIDGTDAENLNSIGLPVGPYPATQKTINFDITSLVPLLAAFPGHHTFTLRVVDNDGNECEFDLKFLAE